jgi:hypothetical protein
MNTPSKFLVIDTIVGLLIYSAGAEPGFLKTLYLNFRAWDPSENYEG